MSSVPQVHVEPIDVRARLDELHLTPEILRDAILAGELARSSCTENDPPAFPGQSAWAITTRSLREQLLSRGWSKDDAGNYSTVCSADKRVALVVATGDRDTGRELGAPKTKCPKGPATALAIERNFAQLELFEPKRPLASETAEPESKIPPVTWVLLIARNDYALRAELSLPAAIGEDDRIESWVERIILEPLQFDDDLDRARGPELGPEFDIDVVRKAI